MNNPYLPNMTIIADRRQLNASTALFRLEGSMEFRAGQFLMLSVAGWGEAPFSISGDMELCVRDTGRLTHRLHSLSVGDAVGWRGPFGTSFEDAPAGEAVYVAGGVGMAALRPAILKRPGMVFLGARSRGELLFPELATHILTDDEGRGFLPDLIRQTPLPEGAVAFLCGPPAMYRPAAAALIEGGVRPERILLSLERRMSCGVGKCGHCRAGGLRICKDGPVFNYADIARIDGLL